MNRNCATESNVTRFREVGLLLVGHGSRQPSDEFRRVVALVAGTVPQAAVEPCYLEFETPTIAEGFRRLVERGARRIAVVPLMLFAADHVKRDIPLAVAAAAGDSRQVQIDYAEHLGCHPRMLELSKLRYDEALRANEALRYDEARAAAGSVPNDSIKGESTVWILVGRGSHDAQATAEMHEFVCLRGELTPVAHALTAFVAMVPPTLDEALAAAFELRPGRIVVQPHLLFDGVILTRIAERIEQAQREHAEVRLIRTAALGATPQLAQALLDRAAAAIGR